MKNKIVTRVIPSLTLATVMLVSNADIAEAAHGSNEYPPYEVNKVYKIINNSASTDGVEEQVPNDLSGKIVILMSNDSHGSIDGYANMPQLEKEFISRGAKVVMVDCGDFSQSKDVKHDYVKESEGRSAIKIMNQAGYDVVALGNHEFDFENYKDGKEYKSTEIDEIQKRFSDQNTDFTTLCANIVYTDNGAPLMTTNCIYEDNYNSVTGDTDKLGIKIGFFALDTAETEESGHESTGKTAGLEILKKKDLYQCAQAQIDDLKSKGADVVICLAHLGIENSEKRANAGDRSFDIYENTDGIDLILDANSHDVMTSGKNDNFPIMSTGKQFENVGVAILDENKNIYEHKNSKRDAKNIIEDWFLLTPAQFKSYGEDAATQAVIDQAKRGDFDKLDDVFNPKTDILDPNKNSTTEETEIVDETTVDNQTSEEPTPNTDVTVEDNSNDDDKDKNTNDHRKHDDDHHHRNNHGHHHH